MPKQKKTVQEASSTKHSISAHSYIEFTPYGDEITRVFIAAFSNGSLCCIKTQEKEQFLTDIKDCINKYKLL